MSKHYNKRIVCEHYRCFSINKITPLGDTEWYYCHTELEALFTAILGNGRKIKGRVWIYGDGESVDCVFYIEDAQISYDNTENSYTDENYALVFNLAKKMHATESCIYEMLRDIRSYVSINTPKRPISAILPRVPHVSWLNLQVESASEYDQYDQFIGSADISLRLPDGEKDVSVVVKDFSCGPEFGSRVFSAVTVDGHSYYINYGSMDDGALLSGTLLYMVLHDVEMTIGLPCGTLMPIIERVRRRLKYRLNVI